MDLVAIETLAEWKLLVNAIHKNPPTFQREAVRAFNCNITWILKSLNLLQRMVWNFGVY